MHGRNWQVDIANTRNNAEDLLLRVQLDSVHIFTASSLNPSELHVDLAPDLCPGQHSVELSLMLADRSVATSTVRWEVVGDDEGCVKEQRDAVMVWHNLKPKYFSEEWILELTAGLWVSAPPIHDLVSHSFDRGPGKGLSVRLWETNLQAS